ncbi:MAG: hypothetical protein WC737_05705 [Parcubacteria group bacterium]|jgi:hypothetical protein
MKNQKLTDRVARKGRLLIQLFGKDGKLKDERVISNLMTNAGEAHIADQLASSQDESAMSHMAIGTGTTAPTSANTALEFQIDRNALTSRTQGAGGDDNDIIYVGDWAAADGTGAITEAGVFNSSANGTMLCRSTFAAINKGASDTLKITWTVTIGAS